MLAALKVLLAVALVGAGLPSGAQTRTGGINAGPEAFTGASAPASPGSAWEFYDAAPELAADALLAARGIKFGQESVKSTFAHGPFKGRTIGQVAADLRAGKISPDDLPVEFVVRNGENVALNNRSLTALRRAGVEPTRLIDRTGDAAAERLLDAHLRGAAPSDVIRIRGGAPNASVIE